MSLILDILAGAFATALDTATVVGCEKIYTDKGEDYYKRRITEAYPVVAGFLKELAEGTKTNLDDKGIDAIIDGIRTSAASHGVELPTV
jgi:hypothetical protein